MVEAPRILRRFADLPEGQMHYREAGRDLPGVPLVLLHQASGGSRTMVPPMRTIGARRPVIAPDLPGNGDSDPLGMPRPAMADYADAVATFLDRARLEQVAVYGLHAGASVAMELALARPDGVRAVILDSMGIYDPAEAERFAEAYVPTLERDPHGAHLLKAWHYVRDTYLFWPWFRTYAEAERGVGLPALRDMHEKVIEVLKSMDHFGDCYRAAFLHDKSALLPRLSGPVLVTAGRTNSQAAHVEAIAAKVPDAETMLTPGVYRPEAAAETAEMFADWLDRVLQAQARVAAHARFSWHFTVFPPATAPKFRRIEMAHPGNSRVFSDVPRVASSRCQSVNGPFPATRRPTRRRRTRRLID